MIWLILHCNLKEDVFMEKRLVILTAFLLVTIMAMGQARISLDGKKKVMSASASERSSASTLYTQADTMRYRKLVKEAYHALQDDSFAIAKARFEAALKAIPRMDSNVEIYYELGQLEEREGRQRSAVDYYTRAIKKNDHYVKAYLRRGGMYLLLGDYSEAINDFDNSLSIDNKNNDAYFFRGCTYANSGQYELAKKDFMTLLHFNAADERATYSLALVELQQGKLDEACVRMNGLLLRYPNKSIYYVTRAEVYEQLKRKAEAEKDWQQAVDLSPKDIGLIEKYAFFLARQHRKGDALEVLKRAESAGVSYTEIDDIRQRIKRYK